MADDFTSSGDTSGGGSTAVLEAPPASSAPATSDASSTSTTTGTEGQADHGSVSVPDVPYSRFDEVNRKYKSLEWASQYDPQDIQRKTALADWIDRDPAGFATYFNAQLQRYGYNQPQQPQQQPQQPQTLPGPDYQYRDESGNVQQFYSAQQMQKALQFMESKILQQVAPVQNYVQGLQQQTQAQADAQRMLNEAESWPHFADFKNEIGAAMAQDRRLSLEGAYRKVVVPSIANRERQALLTELRDKSGATTTSPSSAQPQASEDLSKMSLQQLFAREFRRRGGS